jgi:hypothetical protein
MSLQYFNSITLKPVSFKYILLVIQWLENIQFLNKSWSIARLLSHLPVDSD